MDPCESLCIYDTRNPYGYLSYGAVDDSEDVPQPRQPGCACDACFYGRDRLAMEIIQLRAALEALYEAANTKDRVSTDDLEAAYNALNR